MDLMTAIRVLGDEGRVRILRLLSHEELSVLDLQEILGMGQSRISMQLSQLKRVGFVKVRRSGQKSHYSATIPESTRSIVLSVLERGLIEIPDAARDEEALKFILERRKEHVRRHFDELAGRFGKDYVPGRSWKAMAESLMRLLPPMVIADVGAGEGTLALMLAKSAGLVIAVDSSQKTVEHGAELAKKYGVSNVDYRTGDMEQLPIESESVDLSLMHQSLHHALNPARALAEAHRILKPGGRMLVLDLLKHDVEAARELYADVWLGFSQMEMLSMVREAGFREVDVSVVDRSTEEPHFETVLAMARK